MGQIQDNEQALKNLGNQGVDNSQTIGALPNAAGLTGEADNLTNIANAPINYAPEQGFTNQLGSSAQNMFALGQHLGVQKATAAMLEDKSSRLGGTQGDKANAAADTVTAIGQTGAAEEDALVKSGLSQSAAAAVARLNTHASQVTQQGLQQTATNAKQAGIQDISLAQSGGAQQVSQAGQTALFNETQLEQQYQSQQWAFWTKLATGLLSAGAAVGGVLLAPETGGLSAAAAAAATAATQASLGQANAIQAQANNYSTLSAPPSNLSYGGQTPTASYAPVNDGLPVT
jgi:hypothetical protein